MSDPPRDFDQLCAEFIDGELDEVSSARLARMIQDDPALCQSLQEQLYLSGALARENPEFGDELFEEAVSQHIRATGDEHPARFPDKVRNRILRARRQRQILGAVAVAACLALAAIPVLLPQRGGASDLAPMVAIATYLSSNPGSSVTSKVVRAGEECQLLEGMMRLEFGNGAVVAVEAPADLTVKSPDEIQLRSGNLNAWCPETAHGFLVTTASGTLKDLGTSFGVSANPDGTSDFLVLDGEVEVSMNGEQRTLQKGNAVRTTQKEGLSDLAFEPSAFKHTWPVASGIQSTTGQVIPAPPNTPEIVAAYEDDDHVIVIPERRAFLPPSELPIDADKPGTYGPGGMLLHSPRDNTKTLVCDDGARVRSYLIRYNPVGVLEFGVFRKFEGSVTFDRPILGVITSTGKLNLTDGVASSTPLPPLEINPQMRGLEGGPRTLPDSYALSKDRRTITVWLNAGESVDELRIITADDPPKNAPALAAAE